VSVYGSGVAGVHVGPADTLTEFDLVSPQQPQPEGAQPQSLTAYPYPGTVPTPVCGVHPEAGPATVWLTVYGKKHVSDADGFSSPTCMQRVVVKRSVFPNKIMFVA
jgi:hypothetical protein